MGRMESIWNDPEEFIPERFHIENINTNPFVYVPFSAGSRNCIGQKFATVEMKSIISKVLRYFEISVPSDYEPRLIAELVLRPENGMKLNFKKRQ